MRLSPIKPVQFLTRPEYQPSKPPWKRNGLNISRFIAQEHFVWLSKIGSSFTIGTLLRGGKPDFIDKRFCRHLGFSQRRRNENINTNCILRGSGRGKFQENCPKTLFFLGNSMTIKLENSQRLLSEILLAFQRLLFSYEQGKRDTLEIERERERGKKTSRGREEKR